MLSTKLVCIGWASVPRLNTFLPLCFESALRQPHLPGELCCLLSHAELKWVPTGTLGILNHSLFVLSNRCFLTPLASARSCRSPVGSTGACVPVCQPTLCPGSSSTSSRAGKQHRAWLAQRRVPVQRTRPGYRLPGRVLPAGSVP